MSSVKPCNIQRYIHCSLHSDNKGPFILLIYIFNKNRSLNKWFFSWSCWCKVRWGILFGVDCGKNQLIINIFSLLQKTRGTLCFTAITSFIFGNILNPMPNAAFSSCSAKPKTLFNKNLFWGFLSFSVSKEIASGVFLPAVSNPKAKCYPPSNFVKKSLKEFCGQEHFLWKDFRFKESFYYH